MLLIRAVKRRRSVDNKDESNHDVKRPRLTRQTESRTGHSKGDFIENWLDESCRSRRSTENEAQIQELSDNMPPKPAEVLPSPDTSFESIISTSRKSEASAASVRDSDYHQSLRYRNIYIERDDPPVELMRRATRIISRPRASPEMDDATAQGLRHTARRLRSEAEEELVQQLAPDIIPAMNRLPDQRLARNADQLWSNSVPVPLNQNVLTNSLPLPRPKPDLAFGYSQAAFTEKQLMTIDLLVDDRFRRSYAVLDQKLRFPFLNVEFKSQAKNKTHYVTTNQVAGTGAIALNGHMELIQRSFGAESFDFDEPQFFSVTMDHQLACVNVHWLRSPAEKGQYSFHVEGLSKHLLDDANGLRAAVRAIKNILDYGSDARLRRLCEALDAYRKTVIAEREAMTRQRDQRYKAKSQSEQRRRSRRDQQPLYDQQGYQNPGEQQPSYEQQGNESRPNLRVGETGSIYVEDWVDRSLDGPQEYLKAEERPQRKQTTARRQGRSRANTSAKARRTSSRLTSSRLASGVVEYEKA
jgi:hypothetical protein